MKRHLTDETHEDALLSKRHKSTAAMKPPAPTRAPLTATDHWWNKQSHVSSTARQALRNRDWMREIMAYFIDDMHAFAQAFLPYHVNSKAQVEALLCAFPSVSKKTLQKLRPTFAPMVFGAIEEILHALSSNATYRVNASAYGVLLNDQLLDLLQFSLTMDPFQNEQVLRKIHLENCLVQTASLNQPQCLNYLLDQSREMLELYWPFHELYWKLVTNMIQQAVTNLSDKTFAVLVHHPLIQPVFDPDIHADSSHGALRDISRSIKDRTISLVPETAMCTEEQLTDYIRRYVSILSTYSRRLYSSYPAEWKDFIEQWIDWMIRHQKLSSRPNYLLSQLQQLLFSELSWQLIDMDDVHRMVVYLLGQLLSRDTHPKVAHTWLTFLLHEDVSQQVLLLMPCQTWWNDVIFGEVSRDGKPLEDCSVVARLLGWVGEHKPFPVNVPYISIVATLLDTIDKHGQPSQTTHLLLNAMKQAGFDFESDTHKFALCKASIEHSLMIYTNGKTVLGLYRPGSWTIEQQQALLTCAIEKCRGYQINTLSIQVALLDQIYAHSLTRQQQRQLTSVYTPSFLNDTTSHLYISHSSIHLHFWLQWLIQHRLVSVLNKRHLWYLVMHILGCRDFAAWIHTTPQEIDNICCSVLIEHFLHQDHGLDKETLAMGTSNEVVKMSLGDVIVGRYYKSAHVMLQLKAGLFLSDNPNTHQDNIVLSDLLCVALEHNQWFIGEQVFALYNRFMTRKRRQDWADIFFKHAYRSGNASSVERLKKMGVKMSRHAQKDVQMYIDILNLV